ncbi:DUF3515 domain-containing protein [Agromyces badenianii]|uniref:DUF3515 domain-containing protein n=1 Tax=Agromyces badenianii TaxID=2080742 RepID=A0A2S0WWT0_9MICO|nr:DUF3515 domain-containing protein [Agromyces badenianii]AWB95799.1 DUF3515 domain-containing protein [Agromyces badenianii]PWC04460.1 DUF3515 domain-containing protein [Agromyces badenianii]
MTESPSPARRHRRSRVLLAAAVTAASVFVLAACTQIVPVDAGPEARDSACAAVVVRLPDTLARDTEAEQPKRETNAQGTGAWGTPASVVLRCGAETPGPTTDRCVSVNGVDWVIDETDAPRYLFTTYGRTPAVEVLVDNDVVSGTTVITELADAVSVIPAEGGCTTLDETFG